MANNAVISNADRQEVTIVVKRGADLTVGFKGSVGGAPIKWADVTPRIEVRNEPGGIVKLTYVIGQGLSIDPSDDERLILTKAAHEYNLPRAKYQWDLLVSFSPTVARYPVGGHWISVDSVTQNMP